MKRVELDGTEGIMTYGNTSASAWRIIVEFHWVGLKLAIVNKMGMEGWLI